MSNITINLWYDDQAEEAAKLYTSVFKNGKIGTIARYPESAVEVSGKEAGSVMTVAFEIDGQKFVALNGGPQFKFNESMSLIINCEDQAEVDEYWEKLTADGGQESVCGWLKDKFGFSWQIIPKQLGELMSSPDRKKANAAMAAMLKMKKINVAELEGAADNA